MSGEATGRCPTCGEQLTRKRATGLILKNRFLLLEPGDRARIVIGCPKCKGELELVKGRLLLFRRLTRAPAAGSEEE